MRRRATVFAQHGDAQGESPGGLKQASPSDSFYPSGNLYRHRPEDVFKALTFGDPAQALRSRPRAPGGQRGAADGGAGARMRGGLETRATPADRIPGFRNG
jgi:hypothetical protein